MHFIRLSRIILGLMISLFLMTPGRGSAADHCVVLQYHHFSETTPQITSVTPTQFDAHLAYLQEHEFRVLPLEEVVAALRSGQELPDRCVSLSVDDAYLSVYETAFPRLRELSWPLTVFVNSEAVDRGLSPYMSWDQMREMARAGVHFENHGHSHAHLIRKAPDESEQVKLWNSPLNLQRRFSMGKVRL